jgi:hypothetical protein
MVMLISHPGERCGSAGRGLVLHDEIDAEKTEDETEPLSRYDSLAEQAIGNCRGEQGLQTNHKRGQRRWETLADRDVYAAEIEGVHKNARHVAVENAVAAWPFGARGQHYDTEHQHGPDHAQRKESHRFRIRQAEFGPDEP